MVEIGADHVGANQQDVGRAIVRAVAKRARSGAFLREMQTGDRLLCAGVALRKPAAEKRTCSEPKEISSIQNLFPFGNQRGGAGSPYRN